MDNADGTQLPLGFGGSIEKLPGKTSPYHVILASHKKRILKLL